ncbi:retention module-containing protein, partial [Campylobacter gastrosuis]
MATQVGIAKQVLGSAVAVDALGNQRVINSGDPIFLGEVIKTLTDVSKVIVATNDGKDITILGKDSVKMDSSVISSTSFGDGAVADADALQKAILSGADLTQLEETAAGGPAAGGGAGGTAQITPAYFAAGGHYANVTASTGNLADGIAAGVGGVSPVTGGLTDAGATTGGVVATPINPPAVVSIDGKDPSAPTNNAAPTIKVVVDPGTTPDLVDDNGNIIPTDKKDNGDGTWDITPKDPITDPDNVNVITTDPTTGEKSDPTPVNPNIDTEAPAVVVDSVTSIDSSNPSDNTADTGNVKGSATDGGNPIIDGSKVEIFNSNGEKIGEGTTKDGKFDITTDKPINPNDTVKVVVTDPAGNPGEATGTAGDLTHTNDNEAPAVVVDSVTSIDSSNPADNTADTGNVKGSATDSGNPIIDGSKVEIFNSNGEKIGEGTTKDGKFDITTDKPINPNDTVKVVVTDPAGNPGEATGTAGDIVTTAPHAELEVSDIAYRGEIKLPFAREATIKNVKNIGADQKLKVTLLDQDGNEIPNVNWVKTGNSTDAWGRETLAEMAAVREYRLDLVDANGNVIQTLDTKPVSLSDVVITDVIDDVAGGKDGKLQSGDFTN